MQVLRLCHVCVHRSSAVCVAWFVGSMPLWGCSCELVFCSGSTCMQLTMSLDELCSNNNRWKGAR
jgi:hypothetical protein